MACALFVQADVVIWVDAVRPYRVHNPNHAVQVIGHDNEFVCVQANSLADFHAAHPFLTGDLPQWRNLHLSANYLAKQALALVGHQGDEIGACLAVTVPVQTNRTAMVDLQVAIHFSSRNAAAASKGSAC
jgi:hypothetical protein